MGKHFDPSRQGKIIGKCRLCAQVRELTFEHVPPAKAYNEHPVVLRTYEEFERGEAGVEYSRGAGAHVLCVKCNSTTGGWYGGAFVDWARQGMERIHGAKVGRSLNFHGIVYPLRVLKQIAVIFVDTAIDAKHKQHDALARFILNRESTELPPEFRFFVFWYGGGLLRQTGMVGALHFGLNEPHDLIAELIHPPFGYAICLSGSFRRPRRPEEITHFKHYQYNEAISLNMRLPV